MDREILFRGKVTKVPEYLQDKNRMAVGDWAYGSYVDYPVAQIFDLEDEYVIDPATVGQHVFLEDVKDKKIFTGDILKNPDTEGEYVIDFIGGGFGLFTKREYINLKHKRPVIIWDGLSEPKTALFVARNLKVIGNIHDNPELLKEEA